MGPNSEAKKCESWFVCIESKSFCAAVECVDRGFDPFEHNLVVADRDRSDATVCLAVSPAMRAKGVGNRCKVSDIPDGMRYVMARPRMGRYIQVAAEIYGICLRYVNPCDIHVCSVEECFIDASLYLSLYRTDVAGFARMLVDAVHDRTGLRATAGAGPNLFLSKVTADILAERPPDGVGVLDEDRFMRDVRFHRPLTDIWGIGPDIARRLERHGARDLAGIAAMRPAALYREFGANAERLIDHAWGREPCTIAQIQGHRPAGSSLSNGRVLDRGYGFDEVEALLREMALESGLELLERGLAAGSVSLHVGYEHPRRERAEGFGPFEGPCGAEEPEPTAPPGSTGARSGFDFATSSPRELADRIVKLHRATTRRDLPVRRVCLGFSDLATDGEEHRPWVLRDSSERRGERGARPAWVNPARARQFMAFAALKGYADMVSELALGRSEP